MLCCADASLDMARASGTVRSRHIRELYSVVLAAHLADKRANHRSARPPLREDGRRLGERSFGGTQLRHSPSVTRPESWRHSTEVGEGASLARLRVEEASDRHSSRLRVAALFA